MYGPNIRVREATIVDYPSLLVAVFEYLREFEHKEFLSAEESDAVRRTVFAHLSQGTITVLLAERIKKRKARVIGYGLFDLRPDIYNRQIAWGHQLYIEGRYRNSDVAHKILAVAEDMAKAAGAAEFYIDTAMPAFFQKQGYSTPIYQVVKKVL